MILNIVLTILDFQEHSSNMLSFVNKNKNKNKKRSMKEKLMIHINYI